MTKLAALVPPPGTNKYELAIVAARLWGPMTSWATTRLNRRGRHARPE